MSLVCSESVTSFRAPKNLFFFISINLQWKWNYHAFRSVFWSILSFSLQVYHHRDDRLPHVCSENAFVRKASLVCSQTMLFLMQFYKKKVLKRRPFFPKSPLLLLIVSLAKVPPVCSQTSFSCFRRFFLENKKLQKHYYSNTKCVTEPRSGFAGQLLAAARSMFFFLRSKNHWFYRHFWSEAMYGYINNNIYI